jgi:hypothetical protein
MATIALTRADRNSVNGAVILTWEALGNADDGAPFALPYAADITIQAIGTFGSATVRLQGSNDGVNWHALTQKGGTSNLALTSAGVHSVNEMPAYIRPATTGGTGTDVDVIVAIHARYAKVSY